MRRRLREQPAAGRRAASAGAVERLRNLPALTSTRIVLLYAPLPGELDPLALIALGGGRTFCFPRVASLDPPAMHAVAAGGPPASDDPSWRRGPFGLWEPAGEPLDPTQIDFALVPGLAFTRDGRRLGRGKGFYDRLLASLRPGCFTCGVGHDFQLVDDLPTEPHDATLDAVATPGGVFRARPARG